MKKVLVLCFFPAFAPPVSGGELRLFNMYKRLSERFDISLVSWTHAQSHFEIVRHGETFREYRVPKDAAFDTAYESCRRAGIEGELAGVVCAMVGRGHTKYHQVVAELAAGADAVVHEFPYTLLYDRGIGKDGKPRFYNSHNVESEMVSSLASGARVQEIVDLVTRLERSLVEQSRVVFATSTEELLKFHLLYGVPAAKLRLAPNGFAPEDFDFERDEVVGAKSYALFMGSEHPPNVEGARFVVEVLAPQFPRQRFVVAGRVCRSIGSAPGNVQLLGEVGDDEKKRLFQCASFFVNPIFAGAGTSLKMVEAMAAGLPIVTTHVGARGLGLVDNVDALIAERDDFDRATLRLIQDAETRRRLSGAARRAAFARLSWPTIGSSVADEISLGISEPAFIPGLRRPLILVVNDYSVREAVSGGARRIHSLLRNVGVNGDVALLCMHDKPGLELEELAPGFTEVRVPKTAEHKAFESGINNRNWISINDLSAALFCLDNPDLKRLFRRIGDNADIVIFSHPYMAPLLDSVGKYTAVVYESHNVEAAMKADILKPHSDGEILSSFVGKLESYLLERSDAIICTTEADRLALTELRPDIDGTVVLNGCEVLSTEAAAAVIAQRGQRDLTKGFRAVFVGSGHPPNVDAAKALCADVLPRFPGMQLWIIGSVGESLDVFAHLPGLRRFGVVSDQEKHRLLLEADIAVNPVVSGGGSNLKIADYLGYALPTVSTPDGVRGFAIEDGTHALIRPQDRFAEAIEELIADPVRGGVLAAAGHATACASLDWAKLGGQYAASLRRVATPRPDKAPPRVLVVTYRYTEPCQGGAEEYLVRLLQRYTELYGA
ncbi:MAG: glycosyltransferase family 4 protein, partial [Phyllobacteriaceae bacterium]|nr:glycosyltransferase family 4 protein [Phyllobacteriaceae bacterium]